MSNKPGILVVDDSRPVLVVVRTMLETFGYSADLVDSGTEALRRLHVRFEEGRPHAAAVLNHTMSPMTGLDVRRAMLANRSFSAVPVILMSTAEAAGGLSAKTRDMFSSVLEKPFAAEALRAAIDSAVAQSHGPAATDNARAQR